MINTPRPRLLLLSDLWGWERAEWLDYYRKRLAGSFKLSLFDCPSLAGISGSCSEVERHQQFLNGGIDRAIQALIASETQPVHVLAFSIGGTIAWQAALQGLPMVSLFAVSASRLRFQTVAPSGTLKLWFGEADAHQPRPEWSAHLPVDLHHVAAAGHTCYRDQSVAASVCKMLISTAAA